jgi:hypothetical protein
MATCEICDTWMALDAILVETSQVFLACGKCSDEYDEKGLVIESWPLDVDEVLE